ncbi:MAG: hypothetical protein GX438_08085 [Treponema sp.]|nr:hypothetical protein [Treponema sp.]
MKKILYILAAAVALFAIAGCSTGMHDSKVDLPIVISSTPTVGSDGVVVFNTSAKSGTYQKFNLKITGLDAIEGTELTLVGDGIAKEDKGTKVSWDNASADFTKKVTNGVFEITWYTDQSPSWNGNEPAFRVVYKGTWNAAVMGTYGNDKNISITGSSGKDVTIEIDQIAWFNR